jgi:hypothetical protein
VCPWCRGVHVHGEPGQMAVGRQIYVSWICFLAHFWAFLGKGSSKTPQSYFYKNTMSKIVSERLSLQLFRYQLFLDFFRFILFSGASQRRELKNTTKNILQEIVSKDGYKTNPKPIFPPISFIPSYGVSQ